MFSKYDKIKKGDYMKLACWNVNGLRACMKKGFNDFLQMGFDIIGLQEIKMQPEQSNFYFGDYMAYWNSAVKKGYSGTLVLTKYEPVSVSYGMAKSGFSSSLLSEEHDKEGRIIALEFEKYYFITCYTPNSKRELLRLDYRLKWEDDFREYLHSFNKPIILCGDLNVAHKEIDLTHPRANVNNPGFTPQEREKMDKLLASGFIDTYRYIYPDKKDSYTWWSYMGNSRAKNVGWRIDYFLVSSKLESNIKDAYIYPEIYGSDHCPIGFEMVFDNCPTV